MTILDTDLFAVKRGSSHFRVPASELKNFLRTNFIVNTIAERDALNLSTGQAVYVTDATADSTVGAGGAKYLYDGTSFIKTGEDESFNITIAPADVLVTPTPTGAEVSAGGAVGIIPLATNTTAGLLSPSEKSQIHNAVTIQGEPAVTPLNINGQELIFDIGQLALLP